MRKITLAFILFGLSLRLAVLPPTVRAHPAHYPDQVSSPSDLIDAVNALRQSNGLPPYLVNPILAQIAQAHAEYQASIGSVTHYSADGSRPYQRALAAGYPVAGDLSQGGFFSENIIAGVNMPAADAVQAWLGDAPHRNTMLSPTLRDVGAGVAVAGDRVYYTLDAGLSTGLQASVTATEMLPTITVTGTKTTRTPTITIVTTGTVIPNTPNPDGSIIHIVQRGDTLSVIAYAYDIPINDLLAQNNLDITSVIIPGQELIVRPAPTPTPTLPTPTPTKRPTATLWPTSTPATPETLLAPTVQPVSSVPVSAAAGAVIAILATTLLLAGISIFVGTRNRK